MSAVSQEAVVHALAISVRRAVARVESAVREGQIEDLDDAARSLHDCSSDLEDAARMVAAQGRRKTA